MAENRTFLLCVDSRLRVGDAPKNRDARFAQNVFNDAFAEARSVIVKVKQVRLFVKAELLQAVCIRKLAERAKLVGLEPVLQFVRNGHECHAGIIANNLNGRAICSAYVSGSTAETSWARCHRIALLEQGKDSFAMKVAEIWRFPVKSMRGERLQHASIGPLGIEGDRVVRVVNATGRVMTSRTHPRLLGLHATIDTEGQVRVDNLPWTDPEVSRWIEDIAGRGAKLVYDESPDRFDVLPLLVATDGAIEAFGHEGRRLRANIVIGGVKGLAERTWEHQRLRIGRVLIGVEDLRMRCVMTTFDPDTQRQNVNVLKEIVRKFDGTLALNCRVIQGGKIRVDDNMELIGESRK